MARPPSGSGCRWLRSQAAAETPALSHWPFGQSYGAGMSPAPAKTAAAAAPARAAAAPAVASTASASSDALGTPAPEEDPAALSTSIVSLHGYREPTRHSKTVGPRSSSRGTVGRGRDRGRAKRTSLALKRCTATAWLAPNHAYSRWRIVGGAQVQRYLVQCQKRYKKNCTSLIN